MKTKTLQMTGGLILIMFWLASMTLNAQIQFQGLISENEGVAGWDADGSGPEPAGDGHEGYVYYTATRDYVDPTCSAGGHFTAETGGFTNFTDALTENGFTIDQIKIKMSLASQERDREGEDWFAFGYENYMNFYPFSVTFLLDDEPMISCLTNYMLFHIGPSTGNDYQVKSNYLVPIDVSGNCSEAIKKVAAAFLLDLDGSELQFDMQSFGTIQSFSGNGRSGAYFSYTGQLTKGNPEIPIMGLNANHEGFAGWDADGTGPEPEGNGHGDQLYYGASLDYSGIDPDPGAALGHFIDGASGFSNLFLQLAYREYAISDLKIRLGLISMANDSLGEDWGSNWCNYYNQVVTIVVNNEPIIQLLSDTLLLRAYTTKWTSESTFSPVKNISQNASENAKFVAQSFLLDLAEHQLTVNATNIQLGNTDFNENGRNGAYWEIIGAKLIAKCSMVNCIEEGDLMGTLKAENSPYLINGKITIPAGQNLTIEPGTKLAFRGPYQINVQGSVNASGTTEKPIIFTHSNPLVLWDGFDYDSTSVPNDTSYFNHCVFEHGYGFGDGPYVSGGIFALAYFDKLVVENSIFRKNRVNKAGNYPASGGAVALWESSPVFTNCIFHNNSAKYGGAIMAYLNSDPVISNCLFYNNTAEQDGGAIEYYTNGDGILINNTFADNFAKHGGAIDCFDNSNPVIINTIMWGNKASVAGDQVNLYPSCNPDFFNSNIQGGTDEFGGSGFSGQYVECIDEDPIFVGMWDHPYQIFDGSPCIDAGKDTLEFLLPAYDLAGWIRVDGDAIDIGAYEWNETVNAGEIPARSSALTVYPNPFNHSTNIAFELDKTGWVNLEVYNLIGEKIDIIYQSELPAGNHVINWQADKFANGIYFIRLQTGTNITTHKLLKN